MSRLHTALFEQAASFREEPAVLGVSPEPGSDGPDPSGTLDRLARLAARLLQAPAALITVVEGERHRVQGRHGLAEAGDPAASGVPLTLIEASLSAAEPVLVEDAREHALLPEPGVFPAPDLAAYLVLPLIGAAGERMGALCVADRCARAWDAVELEAAGVLARSAVAELALLRETDERQRVTAALRRSELLYRQLVERAGDIIYRADGSGHLTYANPATERITGFTAAELVGMHFTDLVRPDYHPYMIRLYSGQLDEGLNSTYFEFPILTRDDREVWIGQNVQLLREDGIIVGVQGVARNVTEQREVHEALRESEERLRLVLESVGEGLLITDGEDRVLYANPAMQQITGYAPGELIGNRALDLLLPPEDRAMMHERNRHRLEGASERYEVRIRRRDDSWTDIEVIATPMRDGSGRIVGTLGAITDIGDRKRAERALRESEARYRAVTRATDDVIWEWDILSGRGYWSDALARVFGYQAGDVDTSMDWWRERVHPEDRERIAAGVDVALAGGADVWSGEYRFRRVDGSYASILDRGYITRDEEGRAVRMSGAMLDLSERKAAEEALRESRRALATLMDNLPGMAYRCRNDSRWTMELVSEGCLALTGYTRAELTESQAAHFADLIHADDREAVWSVVQQSLADRRPFQLVYRITAADGTEKWVWEQGRGVWGEDGTLQALEGLITDITESKQADETLREATRRSQQLADRMQVVAEAAAAAVGASSMEHLQGVLGSACLRVLSLDALTLALYDADAYALDFLGGYDGGVYEPGERVPLAGTPSERVILERRSLVTASSSDPAGQGAKPWGTMKRSESTIRTPILADGTVLGVLSVQSYTPDLYTPDDVEVLETVAALAATAILNVRLLSYQRAAEQALRESEERFRVMVEGSEQVFFYIHDVEHRFEYLSPSIQNVLGYDPQELVGQPYEMLLCGDPSDQEVEERTEAALRTGEGFSTYTVITRHRDGHSVPVEVVETPIVREGRVIGIQGFARDITDRKLAEEALARGEQYFRSLTENAMDVIHVINTDGTTRYLSPSITRLLGHDAEALIGRPAGDLIHPDDLPGVVQSIRELRFSAQPLTREIRVRHADGSWRTFEGVMRNLRDDPAVAGIVVNSRDITERKRAEEENLRLAALSRENPNPVLECDAQGRPVHANLAAEEIARELGLESTIGLLPENHQQLIRSALEHDQGFQNVEVCVRNRIFAWTYRPHVPADVVHLFAVDITGRRHMEEQLRYDALHDALTGLPNRLLFMERLAHAILRAKRREDYLFAVLFLDLDRFKVINDSLGHHVGDELLKVVAQRLQHCLRTEDTVARFGGDEFAILLESIGGVSDATRIAERIQAELAAAVNLSGLDVFTSASIGIALSSSSYERPEYLLRNADMAMYRAKAGGHARFEVFDRAMHANALARLQLETDLRRAIERDEFQLHYQPIIDLASGKLRGVEALIRWCHPDRGWLPPDQFIPVAEETGLILPIGRWVVREACRRMAEWQARFAEAAPATMGVNLSAKQFSQSDLVEQIDSALRESGLPAGALRLEITESAVMENADAAVVLLERLKALGVQVSLDDFGTGYSSLSYLHRFPLDALKIDRSFVGRMTTEDRSRQLVQTVLTLARSLGVESVAEGIETAEQLESLRELQTGYGQGYFFARPLPPEQIDTMLQERPEW